MPDIEGLRVDAGVEQGSVISPFYDSMIAKLIAAGPDRAAAAARLMQALERAVVAGPKTNAAFLHALLASPAFQRAEMDTGLIGRDLARLTARETDPRAIGFGVMHMLFNAHDASEAARHGRSQEAYSPWGTQDAFQLGAPRRQTVTVMVDGAPAEVDVDWGPDGPRPKVRNAAIPARPAPRNVRVVGDGNPLYVVCDMHQIELRWPSFDAGTLDQNGDGNSVRAPIIGRVAKVFVRKGDKVAKGDRIAVVEAMKMEHVLHAARDGVIGRLAVKEGDQVTEGALIAALADG
jgi:3-methylcrotonyl-CoA carboxylase alpha subunit